MNAYTISLVLSGCVFWIQAARSNTNTSVEFLMPPQMDDVRLGMSLREFAKFHTNLYTFEWEHNQVDLTQTNQVLRELYEGVDPIAGNLLGSNVVHGGSMATYQFKDGTLVFVNRTWSGDRKKVKQFQSQLISSCIETWGNDFDRRVKTMNRGSKWEQMSPLMLWHRGRQIMVFSSCTAELAGAHEGSCKLCVFYDDDKRSLGNFTGEEVDPAVRAALFQSIGLAGESSNSSSPNPTASGNGLGR